jgi:ubiquinone/menaquinone biosynthesis C-methylase UbiE
MKRKQFKEKKLREEVWEKTGWGKVASWYDQTISSAKSTQKNLILPELLKFFPVSNVKDKRVLDLGCGTGFFIKEYISGVPEKVLGIDIDNELLELAKENLNEEVKSGKVSYLQGDASNLEGVGDSSFDIVFSIESLPNIKDFKNFAKEVSRVLSPGGRFIAVVNHPSFRVPQSSDWYFDKETQRQGRVIYKYRTPHAIQIDMNPGNKNPKSKIFTTTFHRPLEEYLNTLTKAGLSFSFMKEISSNKLSEKGVRKQAEDRAREEIPLFLFLDFRK